MQIQGQLRICRASDLMQTVASAWTTGLLLFDGFIFAYVAKAVSLIVESGCRGSGVIASNRQAT